MSPLALLPLSLLLLAAAPAVGPSPAPPESSPWVAVEPAAVTLLDPGEGTLRVRSYDPPTRGTQRIERVQSYEMEASVSTGGGREDAGVVRMVMDVTRLAPTGEAPLEVAVQLRELDGPGVSEGLVEEGWMRLDRQGRTVAVAWPALPEGIDDRGLLERFRGRAQSLATPMPAEPIGVGARWEARRILQQSGAEIVAILACTLVREGEDGLDIDCRQRQEASGGAFEEDGPKPRHKRELRVLSASVDGRSLVLQSMSALGPLREDGDMHTNLVARTRMGLLRPKVDVEVFERWNVVGGE